MLETVTPTDKTREAALQPGETGAVLVVRDLGQLHAITHRGIAATVGQRMRVELALLPGDLPERASWERALGRWGRACGCEVSSVVALLTMVWLAVSRGIFAQPLLDAIASGAACVGIGVGVGVLTKFAAISWARQRLKRLYGRIVAELGLI
jgi:hypothetical protein